MATRSTESRIGKSSRLLKFLLASALIAPGVFGQAVLTTAQITKRVSPSVVVIRGKTDSGEVLASGFIVSKDGKIATNLHVIRDMKTASVQLANGEVFDSLSVLATDERRDLAIVQIAGFNLPALELGNSDVLTVGEPLVAIGSPRGLEGTVTAGILSSVRDTGDGFNVLQTDASVNPGNSGGPLANGKGQAVGVVSFQLRSAEGLNFAIPINYVRGLLSNPHGPMTLEQMRQSLAGAGPVAQQDSGLPLKEALNKLKEKIPLATYQYVAEMKGHPVQIISKAVVISAESCSVVFEQSTEYRQNTEPTATVFTARYSVPLGTLEKVGVRQRTLDAYVSGTNEVWMVFLPAVSNLIVKDTRNNINVFRESERTEFAALEFQDEPTAQETVKAFNRGADACRADSSSKGGPERVVSGPSLQETLDFLKEKIPLGVVNFVTSTAFAGTTVAMNEQSRVFSLNSCTGVFDRVLTTTIMDDRPPRSAVAGTWRDTVPLGAITGAGVAHMENLEAAAKATFISGEMWGYRVILTSKSKDISEAAFPPNSSVPVITTSSGFFLVFNDESLANRVLEAFWHAAELCRKQDVF